MSQQLFILRPLSWTVRVDDDGCREASASTPFGSYRVYRTIEDHGRGGWFLAYCFQEYYDDGWYEVSSLADGKRRAQADWLERITPVLRPVILRKSV